MATRAIFGLGNPGPRYAATRHNAGFMVVEALARRHRLALDGRAPEAHFGDGVICGAEVRLVKPMRFMNRSGEAVRVLLPEAAELASDVLVVHDELDLPFGRVKLKLGGGTAGHRGLESIRETLEDAGFARLRFGIGRPPGHEDVAEFVLSPFSAAEGERLAELVEGAASACEAWLELGIAPAMNRVNAAARSPEGGSQGPAGGPAPS